MGGELCRTNRGKDVRTLEELDHTESLPPPPPLTNIKLPDSRSCEWSFDPPGSRILVADFSGVVKKVAQSDLDFLLKMYERSDIVVKSKGLAKNTLIGSDSGSSQQRYEHYVKLLRGAKDFHNKKDVSIINEGKIKQVIKGDGTWMLSTQTRTLSEFLKYHESCKRGIDKEKLVSFAFVPLPLY